MNKIQSADAMRAVAALLIAASHSFLLLADHSFPAPRIVGRTGGVDFFFVLSGFLITYVYARKAKERDIAARQFLKKRFLRIYPLVWFMTILALPVLFIFPNIGAQSDRDIEVILRTLALIPQKDPPVLGALWSLSHVVLFYILFSIYIKHRVAGLITFIIWGIGILGSNYHPNAQLLHDHSLATYTKFITSIFNIEFILGAIAAHIISTKNRTNTKLGAPLLLMGLGLYLAHWTAPEIFHEKSLNFWSYALGAALIIIGAALCEKRNNQKIPKIIQKLADSSYAIIVCNLPVIVVMTKLLSNQLPKTFSGSLTIFSIGMTLSCITGVIIAEYIEPKLRSGTATVLDLIGRKR